MLDMSSSLFGLQDSIFNPGAGEKVIFKVATHLATAKAAQKAAALNSKYAGNPSCCEIQERRHTLFMTQLEGCTV